MTSMYIVCGRHWRVHMKENECPVFVWIYIPGWVSIDFVYTVLKPQYSHVGTLFNIHIFDK